MPRGDGCGVRESVLIECRRGNARVLIQFYVQRVRRRSARTYYIRYRYDYYMVDMLVTTR